MLLVEEVIGNVNRNGSLANAYEEYDAHDRVERLVLDEADRKRSRLRTTTDRGTDVGLVVDRRGLSAGDVVAHDDERMIVVTAERQEAAVLELDAIEDVKTAIEFGHHLGNQHRELTVEDGRLYVPVPEKRVHVERAVERLLGDVPFEYERVDPATFQERDRPAHSRDGRHSGDHGHRHGDGRDAASIADTPETTLTAFQLTDSFPSGR